MAISRSGNPGAIVQVQYVRSDTRTSYSSATTGNGTTITELNLTIVPVYATSYVLCHWVINGETHWDNVFLVHKNGTLQTSPAGYNSSAGNSRWSGIAAPPYDNDNASTPQNVSLMYMDTSLGSTSSRTYAPAIRASGGTAYTFYINRPTSSTGADNYEVGVSYGVAWEIYR